MPVLKYTDEDLAKLVECLICKQPITAGGAMECAYEHLLHLRCARKIENPKGKCPFCISHDLRRNKFAEIVGASLDLPCDNEGCTSILRGLDYQVHVIECNFVKAFCPYLKCSWSGQRKEYDGHLMGKHGPRVYSGLDCCTFFFDIGKDDDSTSNAIVRFPIQEEEKTVMVGFSVSIMETSRQPVMDVDSNVTQLYPRFSISVQTASEGAGLWETFFYRISVINDNQDCQTVQGRPLTNCKKNTGAEIEENSVNWVSFCNRLPRHVAYTVHFLQEEPETEITPFVRTGIQSAADVLQAAGVVDTHEEYMPEVEELSEYESESSDEEADQTQD